MLSKLNEFIKNVSGVFLGFMTLLVIIQVFFRYILDNPLSGSQELSIYAMIYVVMLGSTIAVRNKTHIAVDFFVNKLPDRLAGIFRKTAYFIMLIFFSILLVQGWNLTVRSMLQSSPATGMPVGYIVFSIPLCAGICILYILEHLFNEIKKEQ